MPDHWMSAGATHDAYFVRKISLPASADHTWLRIVATGPASIFINGTCFVVWNGQMPIIQQQPLEYLDDTFVLDTDAVNQYRGGLVLGMYDISPYLHAGENTLAVHVTSPGNLAPLVGLGSLSAALSLDVLISDHSGHTTWLAPDATNTGWYAAQKPVPGWTEGDTAFRSWHAPFSTGRPGASQAVYLPDSLSPRNTNVFPLTQVIQILLLSAGAVIGLWLFMALYALRRYYRSRQAALYMLSLAYLPALACELLFMALARERFMPQPFPYTWFWGCMLLALVGVGYTLLWLAASRQSPSSMTGVALLTPLLAHISIKQENAVPQKFSTDAPAEQKKCSSTGKQVLETGNQRRLLYRIPRLIPVISLQSLKSLLKKHWGLLLIMLLAIPMICYHLDYEPYWQDELTSYYAAKGILAHGLPLLPSGFLYAKGELYSYLLALSMALFGEQHGLPRLPSIVAYLLSLPIFYGVVNSFFDRRTALLATAMLAFSPFALIWGRSVRMYEQAQLLTIVVFFLFYKAARAYDQPRLAYLAMFALILAYLSHEESFIVLPALVLCVFLVSHDRKYPLPAVLYQKHWWIAAALGASVIILQLSIVHLSHPPMLGTDQSQQPFIQPGLDNVPYYIRLLFFPTYVDKKLPMFSLNSLLALLGCLWALYRGDVRAKYGALFLLASFLTLVLVFTMTADRYIYPLLPVLYMMGAYILLLWLRSLWHFARHWQLQLQATPEQPAINATSAASIRDAGPLSLLARITTVLLCAALLLLPVLPAGGYNLFISRVTGLTYHHRYLDYDAAGRYINQHWRQGDIVISISPAIIVLYYTGHLDYFFSVDRALYLFEQDGKITDTPTGTRPLLSQGDLRAVLSSHSRIWIVTDKGLYQSAVQRGKRFVFPPGFRIVFNGYGASVYLRDT
ncbi:MAG: glycosyltransferase family 39 protein [Ktedonobacteraceae bacterium]|nr:glycosyltransferase family 39 protein [Ktedonobacteraceae bacterium]